MTREQAVNAYRRTKQLEQSMSMRLRNEILVPYFGGNDCRRHNCQINYETGYAESPVNGKSHRELAKLSRRYSYEQNRIWEVTGRLSDHFATMF